MLLVGIVGFLETWFAWLMYIGKAVECRFYIHAAATVVAWPKWCICSGRFMRLSDVYHVVKSVLFEREHCTSLF